MELIVHGTKGGYKSNFRPNITPPFSMSDVRNGMNNEKPLGKSAYSIAFANGGCVFTKYTIVRDTLRSYATGNVAFSLFLPAKKKLSGKDVKSLLDKLMDYYIKHYVKDNSINRGETTIIQEDWDTLTSFLNEYKEQNANDETIATDAQEEPAFVYYPYVYKDGQTQKETKLEDIFDAPYQDEYSQFKQVFFVESSLKDKPENPLNALRHSEKDLTGKIDLDNPSYTLSIIGNGFNVQPRNKIRKKQTLTITYEKQDFYKTPDTIIGTWNEIKLSHPNCIAVDDVSKTVTIRQIDLQPECKTIPITVKDNKGNLLNGAEIIMESNNKRYTKTNINECTFEGDEIGQTWSISAKIENENLFSDKVSITPDKQNDALKLILKKRKIVNIEAVDENGQKINSFEYWIKDGKGYRRGGQHVFEGNDIEKPWNIEVRVEGYSSDTVEYCPATGKNPLLITVKKRQKSDIYKFSFKEGKNGKIGGNNKSPYTGHNIPSCLEELINNNQYCKVKKLHSDSCGFEITAKPNFGYKFDRWEKQNKNGEYTITAQFKPMIIEGIIALLILIAIVVMAVMFWNDIFSGQSPKMQQQTISEKQITSYVEGDYLILDTLKTYKVNWENQERDFITKSGGGFWYKLTHIFVDNKTADSTKWRSDWQPVYESIEQAITKRKMIDNKKFLELKSGNFEWSTIQKNFEDAINKIDSVNSAEVREKLGDVSSLTLTQIANSINSILTPKEPVKTEQPQEVKKENSTKPAETKQNTPTETQISTQPKAETQSQSATTDKTSEIIQYIKGSELDEAKLQEYKNTKGINQNLKNSIQLCLDFWVLDGSGSGKKSKTYWTFRDKVNADNNFSNSKVKAFLDKMCQEGANPSYSKQDKKKGLK